MGDVADADAVAGGLQSAGEELVDVLGLDVPGGLDHDGDDGAAGNLHEDVGDNLDDLAGGIVEGDEIEADVVEGVELALAQFRVVEGERWEVFVSGGGADVAEGFEGAIAAVAADGALGPGEIRCGAGHGQMTGARVRHPPVLPGSDAGQGFPGFPVVAEPAVDGGVVAAPMFVASAALVGGAALDLGLEEIGDGTVVAGAAIGGQQGLDNAAAGAPFSEQGPEVA